ncbi:hypothetical protein KSD_73830 [Ktedonobacter sp. SOSP1-85]|nr:hypothetical protein KSD_73830 [Ktedonobacter sp. SOSP1-85]
MVCLPPLLKPSQIGRCETARSVSAATRVIIESIIDQLKNILQIEHSLHRSPVNFVVHLIAGPLAYIHQDKKQGLHLDEYALLVA